MNILDGRGWTALHHACSHGQLDACNALLQRGINPNIANNEGNTALHIACLMEREDCVIALGKAGALLNIKNRYESHGRLHRRRSSLITLRVSLALELEKRASTLRAGSATCRSFVACCVTEPTRRSPAPTAMRSRCRWRTGSSRCARRWRNTSTRNNKANRFPAGRMRSIATSLPSPPAP